MVKKKELASQPQLVSSTTTVTNEIFHSKVVGVAFNTFIVCQLDGRLYFVSVGGLCDDELP